MKTLVLSTLALAFGTQAFAASEIYYVQSMKCEGLVQGDTSRISDDYTKILMKFTSFKSTRRDGSLADSLEIQNAYFGPNEKVEETENTRWAEGWHGAPLRKSGQRVFRKSLSGRDDDLNLTVKYVQHRRGARIEILEGFYDNGDDVGGTKGYKLRCTANVVSEDEVKRIDDNTRR